MGARGFEPRYAGLSARSSHSSRGRYRPSADPIPGAFDGVLTGARRSARLAYAPSGGTGSRSKIAFVVRSLLILLSVSPRVGTIFMLKHVCLKSNGFE